MSPQPPTPGARTATATTTTTTTTTGAGVCFLVRVGHRPPGYIHVCCWDRERENRSPAFPSASRSSAKCGRLYPAPGGAQCCRPGLLLIAPAPLPGVMPPPPHSRKTAHLLQASFSKKHSTLRLPTPDACTGLWQHLQPAFSGLPDAPSS
jgi:hypothetical protein